MVQAKKDLARLRQDLDKAKKLNEDSELARKDLKDKIQASSSNEKIIVDAKDREIAQISNEFNQQISLLKRQAAEKNENMTTLANMMRE